MTTFIPRMTKGRFPRRLFRPAGYEPDRSLLATVSAATVTALAVLDLLVTDLATTAGHLAFGLVVFAVVRVCAGLSLTHRFSESDDDTPEATS